MFLLMRCFLPLLSLAMAVYMFRNAAVGDKNLYAPDKPLSAGNRRKVEKALAAHKKEMSNRKPMEQELEQTGNLILNKDKYISGMNALIGSLDVPRTEYEGDYYGGEIFRCMDSMLCIRRNVHHLQRYTRKSADT